VTIEDRIDKSKRFQEAKASTREAELYVSFSQITITWETNEYKQCYTKSNQYLSWKEWGEVACIIDGEAMDQALDHCLQGILVQC
jgi:hypothetical protein